MDEGSVVTVREIEEIRGLVGRQLGPCPWLELTQERVDDFSDAADDWHWAHNDPVRATAGPFGGTIVHAHLTLALNVRLFGKVLAFEDGETMFYGYNRVRFPAPVPVGARVRLRATVVAVEEVGGGTQLTVDCTTDVEGQDRPGCVAQAVWRHYPI